MKTLDWLQFLSLQQARCAKRVFSVTELANAANASTAVVNVELGRLTRKGVLRRYVPGRYGLPDGVSVEDLVTAIDSDAYVTGAAALARHGLITQIPREVECFTRRRHNRSRRRPSPLGTLVFVCVSPTIHSLPQDGLADPAQAICDLVYACRRHGMDPRSLYTFRKLDTVEMPQDLVARYPKTVQDDVRRLVRVAAPEPRRSPTRSAI